MRRSRMLVLSVAVMVLAASAAFAGGIANRAALFDALGLRADARLADGSVKTGTTMKATVLDAGKLAAHGFTGGVKNGDVVTVRVTGKNTFAVETMSQGAPSNVPAVQHGGGGGAGRGAAQSSLNFTKSFSVGADGKLAAQH